MRVLPIVIIGAALFAYGVTRPAAPPPVTKTTFADLTASTRPAEAPKAAPRADAAGQPLARSTPPLSLAPPPLPGQVKQTTAATPAQSAAPTPQRSTAKRTAEVLTVAAIAALIVKESRNVYYATGHPCACPDDRMRNGRSCGGRSAYSRPGGASPLCYPTDVTEQMLKDYRARRLAER